MLLKKTYGWRPDGGALSTRSGFLCSILQELRFSLGIRRWKTLGPHNSVVSLSHVSLCGQNNHMVTCRRTGYEVGYTSEWVWEALQIGREGQACGTERGWSYQPSDRYSLKTASFCGLSGWVREFRVQSGTWREAGLLIWGNSLDFKRQARLYTSKISIFLYKKSRCVRKENSVRSVPSLDCFL